MVVPSNLQAFGVKDIVALDAEYISRRGEPVRPVCICGKSLVSGKRWELFNKPGSSELCPFPDDPETLFVSYAAPAEWSYYLAMGWELPVSILDLYAEMCLRLNGRKDEKGRRYHPSLLMALEYHGLEAISAAEKTSMRNLILSGSYTAEDQKSILAYCWEDVTALERLLPAILPSIDVQQALWRGSYTRVCAAVEYYGIPVDAPVYADLKEKWSAIRAGLALAAEDKYGFGVFVSDSKGRVTWSEKGFETLVCRLGLDQMWPRTPTGKFSTSDPEKGADDDKVFKTMATRCRYLEPLRVVRKTLTNLRRFDLPVGNDGRCRCNPAPWASLSGRNQPGKGNIYGLPKWARRLIRPTPGRALAYVDLRACEYGIAAGLSHDSQMCESYKSGEDVYLRLAISAGAAPRGATKDSHPRERSLYKVAQLAASYGQTPQGLANTTGCSFETARRVHANLRRVYSQYFGWVDVQSILAGRQGRMFSPAGWSVPVTRETTSNFLFNFPIQSAGADILRVATTLMFDAGIRILALVHDAVLIEDDATNIELAAGTVQDCWRKASSVVLKGFELDSDAEIVRYPDTFAPEDSAEFWDLLTALRQNSSESLLGIPPGKK